MANNIPLFVKSEIIKREHEEQEARIDECVAPKNEKLELHICRLCLLEISNKDFTILEGLQKEMLQVLLPDLKLTICNFPVICSSCTETLEQSYNFKLACLVVEDKIHNFGHPGELNLVDLEEIFSQQELLQSGIYNRIKATQKICRTCLNITEQQACTKLYSFEGDPLKNMFEKCLPELNITLSKEPVICHKCLELLENQFNFIMQCLDCEEKINYYCEKKNCYNQVELFNVFLFSTNVEEMFEEPEKRYDAPISVPTPIPPLVQTEVPPISIPTSIPPLAQTEVPMEIPSDLEHIENDSDDSNSILSLAEIADIKLVTEGKENDKKQPKSHKKIEKWEFKEDPKSDEDDVPIFKKRLKTHRCPKCDYKSKYKGWLKNHILSHEKKGTTLLKCKSCSFSTTVKSDMRKHKKETHTTVKTHRCPKCPEYFQRKGNLVKHLLMHDDQTKMLKTHCIYGTKKSYRFARHMLTMFKCKICPYQTRQKINYDKHSLTHRMTNDIKIFNCKKCPYESIKKENLDSHMEAAHNVTNEVKMRKCFLCSFQTKRIDYLKKHMLIHKKGDAVDK